mgnify:CR=1 FL=1
MTVVTSVIPPGSGRIEVVPSPGKDGKYLQGTNLLVTAVSSPGYQFTGWAGSAGGAANPQGVTAISNLSVVAVFSATTAAGVPTGTPVVAVIATPTPAAVVSVPSPTSESGLAGDPGETGSHADVGGGSGLHCKPAGHLAVPGPIGRPDRFCRVSLPV